MKQNKSTIIGFILMTLIFAGYMIYANYQAKKQAELQIEQTVEQTDGSHMPGTVVHNIRCIIEEGNELRRENIG